jgi:hypothetical protein
MLLLRKSNIKTLTRISGGFYTAENDEQTYNYYVNICKAVSNYPHADVCAGKADGSKGYQISADGQNCYPMSDKGEADITAALTSPTDITQGVTLTYATFTSDNYQRTTIFNIMCDAKATTATFKFNREDWETGKSTYHFDVTSSGACPGSPPAPGPAPGPSNNMPLGQLGVGGLIVILLFSFLVLYFIIGALVLKFGLKKEGKEIIPNYAVCVF